MMVARKILLKLLSGRSRVGIAPGAPSYGRNARSGYEIFQPAQSLVYRFLKLSELKDHHATIRAIGVTICHLAAENKDS
jgi:hypothetical protein